MVASNPCTFCCLSENMAKAVITEVRVAESLGLVVLKFAEPEAPNAQPVSGVLNKTGIAR